ncbi:MAG TPA: DPP IV N-terminal domain-containing protein [Thermoanaerobaculia bacterium]|nr:DPP IV N-terminal domain-containing protein [Thermoanaerobaculia bacterium]
MRHPLIACCLAASLAALAPRPAIPEQPPARISIEAALATDATGRRPGQTAWSPDGKRLTYVWDEAGDGKNEALWSLDPSTGKREILVRPADLGEGGKSSAIDSYVWSPRGDSLLLASKGDLYLFPLESRRLRRLTKTEADEESPSFSPDGRRIAFVRAFDLYVMDPATGRETRLTRDGRASLTLNAVTDWVYGEEIWDRHPEAYWWSPDGSRIAYYHFDERGVGMYPLVDSSPLYPKVNWQRYPKAGTTNPKVTIGIVNAATAKTIWIHTGDPESYLARVAWTPKGDALAIQRLNRGQTKLDLLTCKPATGACSTLLTETWKTWINLGYDFRFLPDGRFLWGSERSNWRRLYLYRADGKLIRPLTPEGWVIGDLNAVADDGAWALVTAYPTADLLGPIDRKIARVRLDGDGWDVLTPEPGQHQAVASPRTGDWVHTWSDADTPQRVELRRAGGGRALPLPSAPPKIDYASLPKWEFLTIPGPDGSRLPARILKPTGFDPSKRYPAIVYHYGGPNSQVVVNSWGARDLWHKLMAQRGFVVFSVDNQSSLFFGKAGEDRDYHNLGPVNLAGQLAGVEYLKTLPWVDPARLGLWGWSGGGSNTLYCILKKPGVWKAAIAGAPVTDWRLYDTIWTERYFGTPQENPKGYKDSPITYAANLKDHLLIVHGLADDNVHPQNTIQMSDAFIKAGLPFEQGIYPGQKHGFRPVYSRHFYERAAEFFERQLQGVEEAH